MINNAEYKIIKIFQPLEYVGVIRSTNVRLKTANTLNALYKYRTAGHITVIIQTTLKNILPK